MKKLLCMMLGLAVGAFAYADGEPAPVVKGGDFGFTANEETGTETLTYSPVADDDTEITAYGDGEAKGSDIYTTDKTGAGMAYDKIGSINQTGNANYLKVKNSLTAGGTYAIGSGVDYSKNVCIDTLVRFTAGVDAEEAEYPSLNGAKIGVWLKQVDADGGNPGETNLYVTAGCKADPFTAKAFKINKTVEPGSWHRVTIRTLGNILSATTESDLTGFIVYIDGELAAVEGDYDIGMTIAEMNSVGGKYFTARNLFIDAQGEEAETLSLVGFAGNGDVDDTSISWGDKVPYYAVAEVETTITADEGLESFQYKLGNAAEWITGIPPLKLALEADALITFNPEGFVCTNSTTKGYTVKAEDDWSASGWSINGTSWKFSGNENSYINIGVQATEFAVTLSGVGGFATAEEALAYLESPAGKLYTGTVTFLKAADGTGYSFPANTTIEIADGGVWTITNGSTRTAITWTRGFEAEKQVTINGKVTLGGLIKGNGRVETTVTVNGTCTIDQNGLTVGDDSDGAGAAFVIGETGILDTTAGKVTLGLNGRLLIGEQITTLTNVFTTPADPTKKIIETPIVVEEQTVGYEYKLDDNKFTITFKPENGEQDIVNQYLYGTKAADITPADPVKDGYDFKGWDPEVVDVVADATYTAQWEQSIDYVASVTIEGETTQYASLVEAFAAVEAGETATITLLKSCSGAGIFLTENQNKTITLDLAGYTYTCVGPAVGSTGTQNQAFHLEKGNTVAINNGTIKIAADKGDLFRMVIQNYCDLTLTGVVVDGTNLAIDGRTDTYSASFSNGDVVLGAGTVIKPSTAAGKTNWAMDSFVKTEKGYLANVTVNGATIEGNVELGGGKLVLTAGEITGDLVASSKTDADQVTKAPAFVLGGSIPADYKWDENGKLVKKVYVAQVGTQKFETLAEAITAAEAGETVTLLADITLTATTTITKELALDLAQKTITFADGIGDGIVFNGADGVISNGTITSTVSTWNVASFIDFIQANGLLKDLSLNSANFQWGVGGDLGDDETWKSIEGLTYTVTCENVDIEGPASLFYAESVNMTLDADCSAVQSGAHAQYWRNCAIHVAAKANVTVNGGDYTGTYPVCLMSSPATIAINDGKFTGEFMVVKVSDGYKQYGEHSITISGGDFSDTEIPVEYIAQQAGYTAYWADSEITGYVTPAWEEIKVAKINDVTYADLQAAFNAVEEGQTIELIADITWQATKNFLFTNSKNCTLDLAGHTVDVKFDSSVNSGTRGVFSNTGNLTITDTSAGTNGTMIVSESNDRNWGGITVITECSGTIVFDKGSFVNDGDDRMSAIVNFPQHQKCEAVVNNAVLKSKNYVIFRSFQGSQVAEQSHTVTVKGGKFTSPRFFYMQHTAAIATAPIVFNMTGGEITAGQRVFYGEASGLSKSHSINISGGTINLNGLAADNEAVFKIDGLGNAEPLADAFTFTVTDDAVINVNDGLLTYATAPIMTGNIKGGLFDVDFDTIYLAKGYEKIAGTETGTWTAKAIEYDIAYFAKDGSQITDLDDTYTVEDEVTLPDVPAITGYTVAGWTNAAGTVVTTIAKGTTGNQAFYAKYTANEYTITYDANDAKATGATEPTVFTVEDMATKTIAENGFALEGYDFTGWNTAADGEGTAYAAGAAIPGLADLKLFAQWKEKSSEPIPPLPPDPTDEQKQAAVNALVEKNATLAGVVTKENYTQFRDWARSLNAGDPTKGEQEAIDSNKAAVSFQLSPIVAEPTLFSGEPEVQFTAIAANGNNWDVTLQLKDSATEEEVKLAIGDAKAHFAQFIKKGTEVNAITGTCSADDITAAVEAGASGKQVKLTVKPPEGTAGKGFIKFELK